MLKWDDPNVCVLIHPTAFHRHPDWCRNVQAYTEQGVLKRHYLRFGPAQMALVQSFIAEAPANNEWKIVNHNAGKYILVKVTFRDLPFTTGEAA